MSQVHIKDVKFPIFLDDVSLLIYNDVSVVPLIRDVFDLLVKAAKR